MPFLHTSDYIGHAMLAIISHESVLSPGRHEVLDIEIVESRNEAERWFRKQIINRPWEERNDEEKNTLHGSSNR